MKIRTKLLTAVLATATALSCALTASALTAAPGLDLQGNETAPAKVGTDGNATATLTLKASDFSTDVKGAKIVLKLDKKLTLTSAKVTDTAKEWTVDSNNSKVSGNTVTLVDVFNMTDATKKTGLELVLEFTVKNPTFGSYEVTVSGDFADDAAEKVYQSNGTGTLVINREEASATNLEDLNAMASEIDYFIPYGGASIDNNSLTKNSDGTFELGNLEDGEINVLKCKLPAEGKNVTTFAISPHMTNKTSIQFGSYAPNTNSLKYGTFVIIGDYQAFKAAKFSGKTDTDVLKRFGELYQANIAGQNDENKYMKLKYTAEDYILVGRKSQTKYMWQGDNNQLQYALRMTNIPAADADKTFTAVGYSLADGNTYNFSAEMQSTTLKKLYPEASYN